MPTATPPTAAITGFSNVTSARRKSSTSTGPWPPALARRTKSLMSLPAENAPPLPSISTARMAASAEASASAPVRRSYIGAVSAFFAAGRFRVSTITAPSRATTTSSVAVAGFTFVPDIIPRLRCAILLRSRP